MSQRRARLRTEEPDVFKMTGKFSVGVRWDDAGQCYESVNDGPEQRRHDMDFGTPKGDLIMDPWIQDIVLARGEDDKS